MSRLSKTQVSHSVHFSSLRTPRSLQSPLSEQQVMLFWHLGTLLLDMASRIDWHSLPPKPRRRLRPLLAKLQEALEQAQKGIAIKGASEDDVESERPLSGELPL